MGAPLPASDCVTIVSRASRRPDCEVYPARLRERLPRVAFPLRGEETITLDLQAILLRALEKSPRARYPDVVAFAAALSGLPTS